MCDPPAGLSGAGSPQPYQYSFHYGLQLALAGTGGTADMGTAAGDPFYDNTIWAEKGVTERKRRQIESPLEMFISKGLCEYYFSICDSHIRNLTDFLFLWYQNTLEKSTFSENKRSCLQVCICPFLEK